MPPRKLINLILERFGYQVVKLSRFELALTAIYNKNKMLNFLQIGANDGVKFDNLFSFVTSNKDCSGIVVEPLKFFFRKLEENYRNYPQIIPVNVALHKTERESIIHHVKPEKLAEFPEWAEGIGSFSVEHLAALGIPLACISQETVDCLSMNELLDRYNIRTVDFIQIDVEGYDAHIIEMIDFKRIKPYIIKYEIAALSETDRLLSESILKLEGYNIFREAGDNIAVLS